MTEDPRVETIHYALKILTEGKTAYDDHPIAQADRALASLARDARKAILAEAVVEAAENVSDLLITNRAFLDDDDLRDAAIGGREAIAAYRAEFPADPQEKP